MASFPQINRDRMPFPVEAIPDKILLLGASAHFLHLVAAMTTLVFFWPRRWQWWLPVALLVSLGWFTTWLWVFPACFGYLLGLIFLVKERGKRLWLPVALHLIAIGLFVITGFHVRSEEWRMLLSCEKDLLEGGAVLDPVLLHGTSDPSSHENIWDHSILKTLAEAGQSDPNLNPFRVRESSGVGPDPGRAARNRLETEYEWVKPLIQLDTNCSFHVTRKHPVPLYRPLETLYRWARAQGFETLAGKEEDLQNDSGNPEILLPVLTSLLDQHRVEVASLWDAFDRSEDVYPFIFEDGPAMLMPHLPYLKKFSQLAIHVSLLESYRQDANESFRAAQSAFFIAHAGMSDLLISQLVMASSVSKTLGVLVAAQNQHLWPDRYWQRIDEHLSRLQLQSLPINGLRMERAMWTSWLMGQTEKDPLRVVAMIDSLTRHQPAMSNQTLGSGFLNLVETAIEQKLYSTYARRCSQAIFIKQIRLLHDHYKQLEGKVLDWQEALETDPWSGLAGIEDTPPDSSGALATMLSPAMAKATLRFCEVQLMVEMAKASVSLERFYLKHGRYPEQLEHLVADFCDITPQDPMSSQPFHYRRLGSDGFELYSVGWNGKDEGGFPGEGSAHQKRDVSESEPLPDDVLWRVEGREETFPVVLREPENGEDESSMMMDIEMMKRYGLLPEGVDHREEADLED